MARRFWSEVRDLHAPALQDERRTRVSRSRKRSVRKVAAARRTGGRVA